MTISAFPLGARRGARAAHRTPRQAAIVRLPRRDVVFRRPFSKDNDVTNSHNWCYNDVTNSHNSCCEITFTLCREGALMNESSAGNLEDTCSRERPQRRAATGRLRLATAAPTPEGGEPRADVPVLLRSPRASDASFGSPDTEAERNLVCACCWTGPLGCRVWLRDLIHDSDLRLEGGVLHGFLCPFLSFEIVLSPICSVSARACCAEGEVDTLRRRSRRSPRDRGTLWGICAV